MAYPVSVAIEPQLANRNRLTTFFRLILAIPHMILVGGPGMGVIFHSGAEGSWTFGGENGLLGAATVVLAVVSWFTILLLNQHYAGIREFTRFYMRWQLRVIAYLALLTDPYPPFGDGPYPAQIDVADPPAARDHLSVALRIILAIPQFIVLAFVAIGWAVITVFAWFVILITGRYPEGLAHFSIGAIRWYLRVEAYMLLMTDEYPPFSLE